MPEKGHCNAEIQRLHRYRGVHAIRNTKSREAYISSPFLVQNPDVLGGGISFVIGVAVHGLQKCKAAGCLYGKVVQMHSDDVLTWSMR